jgi:hypothetical protein
MSAFVAKETLVYSEDEDAPLRVSFVFETYGGIAVLLFVKEHQALMAPDRARAKLAELHHLNLIWSWLAGFPGLFPAMSYWNYRGQLKRIGEQEAGGRTLPLPVGESPKETRFALLGFIGIIALCFVGLFIWRWVDPDGLARLAQQLQQR